MSPEDAKRFNVSDGEYVDVDVSGTRPARWLSVQIRVNEAFRLEMHVDTDDANAVGIAGGSKVKLVKR
jgi:putative phosphotransacetylase